MVPCENVYKINLLFQGREELMMMRMKMLETILLNTIK